MEIRFFTLSKKDNVLDRGQNRFLSEDNSAFRCHEEVLYFQPMIPPKRFDIFRLGDA